jgi:hypothetical protein
MARVVRAHPHGYGGSNPATSRLPTRSPVSGIPEASQRRTDHQVAPPASRSARCESCQRGARGCGRTRWRHTAVGLDEGPHENRAHRDCNCRRKAHTGSPRNTREVRLGLFLGLNGHFLLAEWEMLGPKVVDYQHFSEVGRRGLEPRTYGLKAFAITPHTAEYQAIATDSDSPRPSQNHPRPSRKGHRPEHERAM